MLGSSGRSTLLGAVFSHGGLVSTLGSSSGAASTSVLASPRKRSKMLVAAASSVAKSASCCSAVPAIQRLQSGSNCFFLTTLNSSSAPASAKSGLLSKQRSMVACIALSSMRATSARVAARELRAPMTSASLRFASLLLWASMSFTSMGKAASPKCQATLMANTRIGSM